MSYLHGIYTTESPTPLSPPVQVESALPLHYVVAPVHKLDNPVETVQNPYLFFNYGEAVAALGMSDNWGPGPFTASMVMNASFVIGGVAPVAMVNVYDPHRDATATAIPELQLINNIATIDDEMAIKSTVVVKYTTQVEDPLDPPNMIDEDVEAILGTDYILQYDNNGLGDKLQIIALRNGAIYGMPFVDVEYQQAGDPAVTVTVQDFIGGINVDTNARMGVELADEYWLKYQINLAQLLAPEWEDEYPEIAFALTAKGKSLNGGNFGAVTLAALLADDEHKKYGDMPQYKRMNGLHDPNLFTDWPYTLVGRKVYSPSVRVAVLHALVDAANGGRPYVSTSNQPLPMTGICQKDGTPIPLLDQGQANFLNSNGIGTFLNWSQWVHWGGETSAFPAQTDIKDAERSIRRMFIYCQNTVVRTIWPKIDAPINRILIDNVLLTLNMWFNTLTNEGAINGGRVEFQQEDNNQQQLLTGILKFRVFITPPNRARAMIFDFQYDPSYMGSLFAA
jgi:hypothetical protein